MPNEATRRVKLSQRFAEAEKIPTGADTYIFDNELNGFALRQYPGGKRVWMYREGGRKKTIGSIYEINERQARERVVDLRQAKRVGRDLLAEEEAAAAARKQASARTTLTAGYCFRRFINSPKAFASAGPGHRAESISYLERYVLTHKDVMALPLPEVAYQHVLLFVEGVPDGSWGITEKLLGAIRSAYKFFRTDLDEIVPAFGTLPTPPMDDLRPARAWRRDKLSIEQLREVYAAAEKMAEQNVWHSGFFRMMILTLRRKGTVRAMRWADLRIRPNDGMPDHWVIPAVYNQKGRTDGGSSQIYPLTPRMVSIIESMPRAGEYVFGGDKIRIASGGKILAKIRAASGIELDPEGHRWTLHGLRRSLGSSVVGARHEKAVDLLIGHRPRHGSKKSYFQGEHWDIQLEAALAWDELLFISLH